MSNPIIVRCLTMRKRPQALRSQAAGSGLYDLRTNWHAWSSRNVLQQIWSSLAPCHAVSAEDPDPVACRPRALSAVKASVSTVSADCCIGGVQGRLKNPHNSELWLAAVARGAAGRQHQGCRSR